MQINEADAVDQSVILQEVYRGTIQAHHAKLGYDYPTIRLPCAFSGLIGLPMRVYKRVHDGVLAFVVVVSSEEKRLKSSKSLVLTWRRSPVRIRRVHRSFCNRTRELWRTTKTIKKKSRQLLMKAKKMRVKKSPISSSWTGIA
jgi:hypothetical protein